MIANRYELVESMGQGGYGEVYKARDIKTGEYVALKLCLNPSKCSLGEEVRILRELKAKNVHGINEIIDSGNDNKTSQTYMVITLQGQSLKDLVKVEK